jgi:hypothetical protein
LLRSDFVADFSRREEKELFRSILKRSFTPGDVSQPPPGCCPIANSRVFHEVHPVISTKLKKKGVNSINNLNHDGEISMCDLRTSSRQANVQDANRSLTALKSIKKW